MRRHLATFFLCAATSVCAQNLPIPQLKSVFPCGAKQGTSIEVDAGGNNLDEATKLYFNNSGITASLVPDAKSKGHFKVSVAPNVPVGDYDVRLIGKYGISNPRTFSVGDCVEVNETEPNDSREKANRVPMDCVINGSVNPSEDIDWYVFSAKKGQRVLIECRAWRVDSRLDGTLTLYNNAGKELVASQDENIRDQKRDPFIDFDVPADGDYYLRFTDFMYNGGSEYFYRLSVGTHPYVDFITPTGAKPGTTADITFYGRNLPGGEKTDVKVNGRPLEKVVRKIEVPKDPEKLTALSFTEMQRPATTRQDGMEVRVTGPNGVSNAKMLLFSEGPELLEVEPNDTIAQGQHVPVPCAVTGQFSAPKDADHYTFSAQKDEKLLVEVFAERIGSPADPEMEILEKDGKSINAVSDSNENIGQLRFPTNTCDIVYNWTAPKTADFTIYLEHVYRQVQGGSQYQYRLEIHRDPAPDFRLVCSPTHDIHIDSHCVYQGGRQRLDILVWRMNSFDEPITVEARHLPPGVTAEPFVVGPGVKWGTLVVTAAANAPIDEGEIEIVGTAMRGTDKLVRKARGGVIVWDTVNTPAICRTTRSIMLGVRETAPYAITAKPNQLTIKPGDPINLTVSAERRADMPSAVQLHGNGIELPPGVTIPTTTIDQGKKETKLTVATTDKLKPGIYSFIINSEAQVPNGTDKKTRCIYPSNPITITVQDKSPRVTATGH